MKKQTTKYFIIGFLTLFYACSPMNKEVYLDNYKDFIEDVSNNHDQYTMEDWNKTNEMYDKYSNEWYKDFKEEFSWSDKVLLKKYDIQFNVYRVKAGASVFLNSAFGTYDDVEKKVKYYSENDMTKDLDLLIKQANELGGTATETLGKILDDLELEYEGGYNVKLKKK